MDVQHARRILCGVLLTNPWLVGLLPRPSPKRWNRSWTWAKPGDQNQAPAVSLALCTPPSATPGLPFIPGFCWSSSPNQKHHCGISPNQPTTAKVTWMRRAAGYVQGEGTQRTAAAHEEAVWSGDFLELISKLWCEQSSKLWLFSWMLFLRWWTSLNCHLHCE